jgi:hypothetical protein
MELFAALYWKSPDVQVGEVLIWQTKAVWRIGKAAGKITAVVGIVTTLSQLVTPEMIGSTAS